MSAELSGRRIAILVTNGVEQAELREPRRALEEAGATVELLAPSGPSIQGMDHQEKGELFEVDGRVADAEPADYDGLVLPGGVVNGRVVTSYPSLRTDLENAGARWVDSQVHNDNGRVTSRNVCDLPAFCEKLVEELGEGRHLRHVA